MMIDKMRALQIRKKILPLIIYDALLSAVAIFLAIQGRYYLTQSLPPDMIDLTAASITFLVTLFIWPLMGMHKLIWRFTTLHDATRLFLALSTCHLIVLLIFFMLINRANDFPRLTIPLSISIGFFLLLGSRILYMLLKNGHFKALLKRKDKNKPFALLVGSVASINDYLNHIRQQPTAYNIAGLITDKGLDKGRSIDAYPIFSTLDMLKETYQTLSNNYPDPLTLIVTDKTLSKEKSYQIIRTASVLGAPVVRVTRHTMDRLTPFEAVDLIGRKIKTPDITPVQKFIKGRKILVTGAGGSIGTELTRQLMQLNPAHLTLIDHSEFHLYKLDQTLSELDTITQKPAYETYLADIRDKAALDDILIREQPHIIFHAAALKHVPLGEKNPFETLKTNINGTHNMLTLAQTHAVEHFVLISTDKAVKPNSAMGASKCIAEMLLAAQSYNFRRSAVRFGNVLSSNGSVLPLFEKQIARGGPVTVTDKNVSRYFMTTEEAISLILQAATLNAQQDDISAQIYVLDMGTPVNITQLARQLIRLHGYKPDKDIKIVFTGLRPGEVLHETLLNESHNLTRTPIDAVNIYTPTITISKTQIKQLQQLLLALENRDKAAIAQTFTKIMRKYPESNRFLSN